MVLSTTFALAQRHERREMNGNNKMTSFLAGMSCFPSERVVKVVVLKKRNGITNNFCARTTPRAQRNKQKIQTIKLKYPKLPASDVGEHTCCWKKKLFRLLKGNQLTVN